MTAPRFVVVGRGTRPAQTLGTFTLVVDMWDDFHFKTLFSLFYGLGSDATEVGEVKIASRGMKEFDPHTVLPSSFSHLESKYFALGQGREFYENIMALGEDIGAAALKSMRDVASDSAALAIAKKEAVFSTSLLRSVPLEIVHTQFQRIAAGKPTLTAYDFEYEAEHKTDSLPPLSIGFEITPNTTPPTNLHVLIGANGVGKSQLMRKLVAAATRSSDSVGRIVNTMEPIRTETASDFIFTNILHVAFSAFDLHAEEIETTSSSPRLHSIGLPAADSPTLTDQFVDGLRICSRGPRRSRWLEAVATLAHADRILIEYDLPQLLVSRETFDSSAAIALFDSMSSGHKIAVLTVTRVIELAEEQSLILIDEPETHLHPPLLSALIRSLSDLIIDRNAVAVIATHSPVILQEVPASCVWMLQRSGSSIRAERPQTETFGESVSRLTSEVFGLDVNRTGYTSVLQRLLHETGDSESVLGDLGGQLGSEGRFVLSSLEASRGDE